MVTAAIRDGFAGEGLAFAFGTLSLLATGVLLVLKVPENRLSWVMLLVALGDGLMNAADVSDPGSLVEIVGVSPSSLSSFLVLASSCPSGSPPAGPSPRGALGLGRGDGRGDRSRRRMGEFCSQGQDRLTSTRVSRLALAPISSGWS